MALIFRTKEMAEKYLSQRRKTIEHLEVVKEFIHWKIVKNEFPYDVIATVHDLLVPKRQVSNLRELAIDEWEELLDIWEQMCGGERYDKVCLSLPHNATQKEVLHFHLLKIRVEETDL